MYEKVNNWFDIVELEKEILKFWEENKTFSKLVKKNKNNENWSFLDGPITANNPMGVHHAWGRALKDGFQRYHAMNGKNLRYQNGFDCQGLWVEVEVEKQLGFKSKKDIEEYGIDSFVNKCKERVRKYSKVQTDQSKRLGYWMDWDNSYYTMSDENNYTIWTFLKKCFNRGLIYKGNDVMPWCPRCGTGISQHEMQEGYKDVKHLSVIVKLPIINRENEAFLVWTTTPWTLTSNIAIAVNPTLNYIKVKQDENFYYLIESRKDEVLKKDWEIVEKLTGKQLLALDLTYKGPFDELPAQSEAKNFHKTIPWKDITEDEGTGIVHIATGCGAEDHILGKEFDLPTIAPIEENGCFKEGFSWLTKKHASLVAVDIIKNLAEKNILYSKEKYLHSYPHCWRCGQELLFRLVDEWFIKMDPWRDDIKEVAKKINWIPSYGKKLELDWLTNMKDWMISKKRYWGLALPIWECKDCNEFFVIGNKKELKEKAVEGWDDFEGNSPHKPWIDKVKIKCESCGKNISRVLDVGNPWLDAGIVPYSTVDYNNNKKYWEEWMPADLVLECFPGQFRNWFYSLLAMSTMMENIPPFKTLLGHALVKDEQGKEMHKSTGNAIWFDDAAEKMGTEVMRWMFFNHEITSNLNFGYDIGKMIRGKFFNTLWNSYAFFINYARLIEFIPSDNPSSFEERPEFDRWIISKLNSLVANTTSCFEKYEMKIACKSIEEFVEELSNWYIRNNRRRFWGNELEKKSKYAYETLYECLTTLIKILAPMLPIITETIYQNLILNIDNSKPESIHLNSYPKADSNKIEEELVEDMDVIIKINTLALSIREKTGLKVRQPLQSLIVSPNKKEEEKAIRKFSEILKDNLNVKEIIIEKIGKECPIEYEIKPNMKNLGPKYGKDAKNISLLIQENTEIIKDKISKNIMEIKLSEEVTITKDDLYINEIDKENLSVVRFNNGWIGLDTEITEELEIEGIMRDIVRQFQVLRKKTGLEIEDRIKVQYYSGSSKINETFEKHNSYIKKETLCTSLCTSLERRDPADFKHTIKIKDSKYLYININKS